MNAILIKVGRRRESKNGGTYQRCVFKSFPDNKNYIFDCYHNHYASKRFLPYLKEQMIFTNLSVFKDKYIDGNSNFTVQGIKVA